MGRKDEPDIDAQITDDFEDSISTMPRIGSLCGTKLKYRYLIEKELGRGGIGIVYLAKDELFKNSTPVVVKILKEDSSNNAYLRERFLDESENLSKLKHYNVVRVTDKGETAGGHPFFVMEYIEGEDLRPLIQEAGTKGMEFRRVARIMREVCAGLSAAHRVGIIHCDLSPSNIMLCKTDEDEERVQIIDFGIAKTVSPDKQKDSASLTEVFGKFAYMAPEQIKGKVTTASDIYALGVIAYEMLTGCRPFNANNTIDHYESQRKGVEKNPKDCRADLPEVAQKVILKALHFERSKRYEDVRDFGEQLAKALTETPPPNIPDLSRTVAEWQAAFAQAVPASPLVWTLSKSIAVSHQREASGEEILMYTPGPSIGLAPGLMSQETQEPETVPISAQELKAYLKAFRHEIRKLIDLALAEQKRPDNSFEVTGWELATHVLPKGGLFNLLDAGSHPQFDLVQDLVCEIPWEALEEYYVVCRKCGYLTFDRAQRFCLKCWEKMDGSGGKLSLIYYLSHLARGQGRPGGIGNKFLFVEDPRLNLCNDVKGTGAEHLSKLHKLVEQWGYKVEVLRGKKASSARVLNQLADPALVGLYYFGEGYFPHDSDEGFLLLADGPLFASQIETQQPTVKFVFLNTCEAPGRIQECDIDRSRSVANAFARGGRKVVIAPLWAMVSAQAADTALIFFQHALALAASPRWPPLAEALREARQYSYDRYKSGDPHIAWMAYRYFGDPNLTLPGPTEPLSKTSVAVSRVFDRDKLDAELFAFEIDNILGRAAMRRNQQTRARITAADFLAGMIRRGDLTRYVLIKANSDLGTLYQSIYDQVEEADEQAPEGQSAAAPYLDLETIDLDRVDEEKLKEILAKFFVRDRDDFTSEVIELLESAYELAHRPSTSTGDNRISEQHLLESWIASPIWAEFADIGLPSASTVKRLLRQRAKQQQVDENGVMFLAALDADARKIVETAHILSQQRGEFPIPNRLMLAAFLVNEKSYAAEVCRRAGCDAQRLLDLMLLATSEDSPLSFALSYEACQRIVLPVIEQAQTEVAGGGLISEPLLLQAFCQVANVSFKEWIKEPPVEIDLDELGRISVSGIDALPPIEEAPLSKGELESIAQERVSDIASRLAAQHGVSLDVGPDVLSWIVNKTNSEGSSLRALQQVIDDSISPVLAAMVLNLEGGGSLTLELSVASDDSGVECILHRGISRPNK